MKHKSETAKLRANLTRKYEEMEEKATAVLITCKTKLVSNAEKCRLESVKSGAKCRSEV